MWLLVDSAEGFVYLQYEPTCHNLKCKYINTFTLHHLIELRRTFLSPVMGEEGKLDMSVRASCEHDSLNK